MILSFLSGHLEKKKLWFGGHVKDHGLTLCLLLKKGMRGASAEPSFVIFSFHIDRYVVM